MQPQEQLLHQLKHHNYNFFLPAALLLTGHHLTGLQDPTEQTVVFFTLVVLLISSVMYFRNRQGVAPWMDVVFTWGQLGMLCFTLYFEWQNAPGVSGGGVYLLPAWGMMMVWHWTVLYHQKPALSLAISGAYFTATVFYFSVANSQGNIQLQSLDVAVVGLLAICICQAIHHVYRQVSEEGEKREKAEKLAIIDPLTRLPNRRAFQTDFEVAVEQQLSTHLVVFDIDHFKRINDRQGHDVGDLVLQHIASQSTEVFSEHGLSYRWGGEEFCVILQDITPEDTESLCEHFRRHIETTEFINELRVTISVGITRVQPWDNAESAFRRADGALLNVKTSGRNNIRMV